MTLRFPSRSSGALVALTVVLLSGAALAQPAYDTCAGAIPIPSTLPHTTAVIDTTGCTTTGETFSCGSWSQSAWFSFTPSSTAAYRFQTCGTGGTMTDTVLAVFQGACGSTTQVTGACRDQGCSTGDRSLVDVTLTAGTQYWIVVGGYTGFFTGNTVAVSASLAPAAPVNDVCTSAIPIATERALSGTTELATNNTQLDAGTAYFDGGTAAGHSTTAAAGRDVSYMFTAPGTGAYTFRTTVTSSGSPVLYVTDNLSCNPGSLLPANVLSAANRGGLSEVIDCHPLQAGQQVYVFVDDSSSTFAGEPFEIEVTPCLYEREPNSAVATAGPVGCGITGALSPPSDVDFYDLGSYPAGSRVFAIVDSSATNGGDLDLRVTSSTATLEYDDWNNVARYGSSSGNVAGTPVAASGNTYLRVSHFSGSSSHGYRVVSVVQPLTSAAEAEPNDSIGQASSDGANYFNGAITAGDSDFFSFTANTGDLIHVALDGDPDRNNTPFSGQLTLLASDGTVLLNVNDTSDNTSSTTAGTSLTSSNPFSPGEALLWRARAAGTYYVRVQGESGTSAGNYLLSIAHNCGIRAPGSVTQISPPTGSTAGGTAVTVTGSGFVNGARVQIGSALATNVQFVNSTTLTAVTPPGPAGQANVTVIHPGGTSTTLTDGFLYGPPPDITGITPSSGTSDGGTAFTITGTDLNALNLSVTIGGTAPASFTLVSPARIDGVTQPHVAGIFPVVVTNGFGSDTFNSFTFIAPPRISLLTPPSGPTAGGTTVVIDGSGFTTGSIIRLDGVQLPQLPGGTATQISFTTPAHAAGAVSIQVENVDGQEITIPGAFTFVAPPDLQTVAPLNGSSNGGDAVVLTGSNFDSNAKVFFGTEEATAVVVSGGGTTINALTPSNAPGTYDVAVQNADGQRDTLTAVFTFASPNPPPDAQTISASSGTTNGGESLIITGTGFLPGATVNFGSTPATNVVVDPSGNSITLTTPAHAFGAVTVTVVNTDSQSDSVPGQFTFIAPAPTLVTPVAMSPVSGRATTTTNVTINGDEFLSGATVDLGGTACVTPNVTKTVITCVAQPHAAGFVTLTVTNPDGKTATQLNAFEYIPAPTVATIAPNSGTTLGGTTLVVSGTGFRSGATVTFGGTAAPMVSVNSATQLTVTTPPRATAGAVTVVVTNTDGQSATVPAGFTYIAPPTITSIAPTQGYASGNTLVTITGTAFSTSPAVNFVVGGTSLPGTSVTRVSATQITARTPAHTPGLADVQVINSDGQSFTLPNAFRFVAAPTLAMVMPADGPATGGARVTLTGANFLAGAQVSFGGAPGIAVAVNSSGTTATATTTAHAPGLVDVTLTNPDGQTVTLAASYTFNEAPVVTAVSPTSGSTAGGGSVTLTGTGFKSGAAVLFGTTAATVTATTATSITVTLPARPAGVVSVTVTNPDGQSSTLPNAFRYVAPPSAASVTPNKGPTSGGTRVTITGTGFTAGVRVRFANEDATDVIVLNATTIEALTPAHAAGIVNVVVEAPNIGSATLSNGFTYEAVAPTVTQVTPSSGSTQGGTVVTIAGSNFEPGATVKFGGTNASAVIVVSSTQIRATPAPHAAGTVAVDVFNPSGLSAQLTSAYTYVEPAPQDEGRVTDGGTGGVTNETGGDTDVIRPAGACGCNSSGAPLFGLLALMGGLLRFRRRN